MVLWTIDLSLTLVERPSTRNWLWLGVAIAAGVLLRQVFALPALLAIAWIFWKSGRWALWRQALIPIAVLAFAITPWTVRNYVAFGTPLLLNSNAGFVLYSSLHPRHGTYWDANQAVVPIPADWRHRMNEAQLDKELTREALSFVLADPVRLVPLSLSKVPEFFKFGISGESGLPSNLARVSSFLLVVPFAVVGMLAASRKPPSELSLLYGFMGVYTAIHIVSWASVRYRLPVDACLVVFAGLGLS
jgi:hypothetical protein